MADVIDINKLMAEISWPSLKMQRKQKATEIEKREFDNNQATSFVQRVRTIFAREQSDTDKRYASFRTLMLEIRSEIDFETRVIKIKEALEDMKQEVRRQLPKLREAKTKYQEEKADFDNYRALNGLTRPAIEKPDHKYFYDLIGILAIEALGNISMIAPVSPNLVVAIILSMLIGFANLSVMFLVGYFGTKGFYTRFLWRKVCAFLAVIFAITVMPFFHWIVSMYRSQAALASKSLENGDIMALPSEGALFEAVVTYFSKHGIGFLDLTAVLMFVIGIIMGIYAWYKGHNYGDPITEYAAREKKLQERHDNFLVPSETLRESIVDLRNEVLDEISDYLRMLQPRLQNIDMHVAKIDGFEKEIVRFCDSCRSATDVFLKRYKSDVLEGDIPPWFSAIEEQAVSTIELPDHFTINLKEARDLAEQAHKLAETERPRAEAYQNEAFNKVDQLQEKVDKLLEGVDA
ncbi:hypothetical protein [Kordiimonas sp.]|uniref:hypothetical protein n=1 Tax=Kordiimonas sp. TaxID=1970157 RepID=UPI003B51B132